MPRSDNKKTAHLQIALHAAAIEVQDRPPIRAAPPGDAASARERPPLFPNCAVMKILRGAYEAHKRLPLPRHLLAAARKGCGKQS